MATILLTDPDQSSRVVLTALLEALGHRVVDEIGNDLVDVAVIEPASRRAMSQVELLRAHHPHLPVVCVSGRRRSVTATRLDPVAYIAKPVLVGPFVRAVTVAVARSRASKLAAA